jgi:hypothetical protein
MRHPTYFSKWLLDWRAEETGESLADLLANDIATLRQHQPSMDGSHNPKPSEQRAALDFIQMVGYVMDTQMADECVKEFIEVRDPDDEIVGYGFWHVERMDDDDVWIGFGRGVDLHLNIHAVSKKRVSMHVDMSSPREESGPECPA